MQEFGFIDKSRCEAKLRETGLVDNLALEKMRIPDKLFVIGRGRDGESYSLSECRNQRVDSIAGLFFLHQYVFDEFWVPNIKWGFTFTSSGSQTYFTFASSDLGIVVHCSIGNIYSKNDWGDFIEYLTEALSRVDSLRNKGAIFDYVINAEGWKNVVGLQDSNICKFTRKGEEDNHRSPETNGETDAIKPPVEIKRDFTVIEGEDTASREKMVAEFNRTSKISFFAGLYSLSNKVPLTAEDKEGLDELKFTVFTWNEMINRALDRLGFLFLDRHLNEIPHSEINGDAYREKLGQLCLATFICQSLEHSIDVAPAKDQYFYLRLSAIVEIAEQIFGYIDQKPGVFVREYVDKLDTLLTACNEIAGYKKLTARQIFDLGVNKDECSNKVKEHIHLKLNSALSLTREKAVELIREQLGKLPDELVGLLSLPKHVYINKNRVTGSFCLTNEPDTELYSIVTSTGVGDLKSEMFPDYALVIKVNGDCVLVDKKRNVMVTARLGDTIFDRWTGLSQGISKCIRSAL